MKKKWFINVSVTVLAASIMLAAPGCGNSGTTDGASNGQSQQVGRNRDDKKKASDVKPDETGTEAESEAVAEAEGSGSANGSDTESANGSGSGSANRSDTGSDGDLSENKAGTGGTDTSSNTAGAQDSSASGEKDGNQDSSAASGDGPGSSSGGNSVKSGSSSGDNSIKSGSSSGGNPAKKKSSGEIPSGSGTDAEDARSEMTDYFLFTLSKAAKADYGDIRYYLVDDFDRDGKYEGFFYIGKDVDRDFGSCDGEIWFVNDNGSKKIHDEFSFALNKDGSVFGIIEGADKNFVTSVESYATDNVTRLYYTDGSECVESAVSGIGSAFVDDSTGDLIITVSAYDQFCDYSAGSDEPMWTGHTWKPYYFYYSRNTGDFAEYGAESISAKELKQFTGENIQGELEKSGYTLGEIIKRDNWIVNVNYSKTTKNKDGSKSIEYGNINYDRRSNDYLEATSEPGPDIFASDFGGTYKLQILGGGDKKSSSLPDKGGDVYGVFVMSAKKPEQCIETESKLFDAGFEDNLLIYTPDFSGLNQEPYYSVSVGLFKTKSEAEKVLKEVKAKGFSDAYVKLAGKYTGDKYLYTMTGTEGIEILKDCVILHDVDVSLQYPVGSENSRMDLYVYKDAVFNKDADLDSFANYEKGDTPYKWIVKNYNLEKNDTDKYLANGPALSGVFKVSIEEDKITDYYGSYWWD
ncbi:MAG: SPOR domain-containing protein [Butyrivibrio sp.]|nr:SPOR domain-containing protein [Butyrivibrio sp.]